MTLPVHRLFLDGAWHTTTDRKLLRSPYSGEPVAEVCQADAAQIDRAILAAHGAFSQYRRSSAYLRGRLLHAIAQGILAERASFVTRIIDESGKPRTLADAEVSRAIGTFTIAAEEARRFGGELIPVDLDAAGRAYGPASVRAVPRGPVLAITPFNFPLNLVAHKLAPALAVGASVLLKPPPQAPGAAVLLAEIFARAAAEVSDARERVPPALLQVLSGSNEVISRAIVDPRLAILSFTGSDAVGWKLGGLALKKKLALELGGNAAVIVHADADLARAAARIAWGGNAYAGQVCISVQRVLVDEKVLPAFRALLLAEVEKLVVGDPALPEVVVGPLIDRAATDRVELWVKEAIAGGAVLLTGGGRTNNVLQPVVLEGARADHKVHTEEVFGPVLLLDGYARFEDAIAQVNDSRFGLQAGLFTDSARLVAQASDELEVGGIIVNDVPTYRADNMPYGGMKDSGLGREGVRYAMDDFCERKVVVTWRG